MLYVSCYWNLDKVLTVVSAFRHLERRSKVHRGYLRYDGQTLGKPRWWFERCVVIGIMATAICKTKATPSGRRSTNLLRPNRWLDFQTQSYHGGNDSFLWHRHTSHLHAEEIAR